MNRRFSRKEKSVGGDGAEKGRGGENGRKGKDWRGGGGDK